MENIDSQKLEHRLVEKVSIYLKNSDVLMVEKAIKLAREAHNDQRRRSGEPFINHPLNVALILTELKVDTDSIIAAILHDTIEDTELTAGRIKKEFNSDVANLVESITKLSNIRIKKSWFPFYKVKKEEIPEFERQVETLRKMLVAMSKDTRVVLIKLADKIHNLKTLEHLDKDKRERIASETIEIFAPIAERLGIGKWKGLLEDLAFPHILPKEYAALRTMAIPRIRDREAVLKKLSEQLEKMLSSNAIKSSVDYRAKRWYSLYKKLNKNGGDLDKIYDLIAIRVIVDSLEDCYAALGIIHGQWRPLVGRIKDYIALPKPNGYKSIHTTVFSSDGNIVEIQIRTKEMHEQAEFGIASHWIYSENKEAKKPDKSDIKWLEEFSKIQSSIKSAGELLSALKMDMFEDRIFAFTPDGDVKDLPTGATPIDFAYSIHTDIGNHSTGARINGKIAPFNTKLSNGDIVEIITQKNSKPKAHWLGFAKTQMARSQIKKYLK